MKPFRLTIIAALVLLFVPLTSSLANPPALDIVAVAQIAQKDLIDRNMQNEIFVAEIEYKGKFGTPYWMVYWSKTFPAQTKGGKEWGLRIQMDGSFVRMVRKR